MKAETPRHIILRLYLLYALMLVGMGFGVFKTLLLIMDEKQDVFNSTSSKLEQRTTETPARRGEILDENLNPLVTSVSYYDIYMDPVTVKDQLWNEEIGNLSVGLAKLFPEKSARDWDNYLRQSRERGKRYVLIKRKVTNEMRKEVRELPIFKQGRFKGGLVDNQVIIERKRPNNDLLSRTLGYVRYEPDDTLLVGLEGAFNSFLEGQKGMIVEQRIAQSWKPTGSVVREAINGYDLVTTINKEIQEVAHTELLNQLKNKGGRYGTAIVMEVKTGYIKAIVNLQKDKDTTGNYREVYNHGIGTRIEQGSTMKLAALMAALEDGKVKLSDTINANGRYVFFNKVLRDDKKEGYGKISIKRAFEYSSNVIGKIIYDNYEDNPDAYIEHLNRFGLTDKTGVRIKGEEAPIYSMPGSKSWWGGSLAWLAIGYEFQLTPLQLLSFYNAVANDGKYMEPQFVSKVIANNNVVEEFAPIVKYDQIASHSTIETMKSALEGVVLEGTAKNLRSSFFKIAGKTGTAQITQKQRTPDGENNRRYVASFVGYFPADDPIYSCIVLVSDPDKDIYGVSVSGTVFSAIANKVYASSYKFHKAVNENEALAELPYTLNGERYDLETSLGFLGVEKEMTGSSEWMKKTSATNDKIVFADYSLDKKMVPDVRGFGLVDAIYLLEERGLIVNTEGYGHVVSQTIRPGTPAVKGALIELKLK